MLNRITVRKDGFSGASFCEVILNHPRTSPKPLTLNRQVWWFGVYGGLMALVGKAGTKLGRYLQPEKVP